jgi:hypothetical protein
MRKPTKPMKQQQLPEILEIKPEDLKWPEAWSFQVTDGSLVSGEEFSARFARIPGKYPIFARGQRVGTFTNHGDFWPN